MARCPKGGGRVFKDYFAGEYDFIFAVGLAAATRVLPAAPAPQPKPPSRQSGPCGAGFWMKATVCAAAERGANGNG
jgi:hypothetical protein